MNFEITLFGRIDWTTYGLRTITVEEALSIIRDGTYFIDDSRRSGMCGTLREITEQIQHLPQNIELQPVKAQFLPAVSWNGVYNNGIVSYSSITALDFDHIPSQQEYTDLFLRLTATSCVIWTYRTPSGHGLKAGVLHDNTDPEMHSNMYQQLMMMFQTPYIKTDPKCKDLSRRNYLCYDPNVWVNNSPIPYHFVYDSAYDVMIPCTHSHAPKHITSKHEHVKPVIAEGLPSDASVMSMLKSRCKRFHPEYFREGWRRDGVYWFGTQAAKAGVDYQYGLEYVQNLYQSREITLTRGGAFTKDEAEENYTNGYDTETYDMEYRRNFIIKRH